MQLDNPFLEQLGFTIVQWRKDFVELALTPTAGMGNRTGVVQGGLIATALDAACGYAGLYAAPDSPAEHSATVSLNINYISSVPLLTRILFTGTVVGQGRGIYFSAGEARAPNGQVLACAQGAFKRRRPGDSTAEAAPA